MPKNSESQELATVEPKTINPYTFSINPELPPRSLSAVMDDLGLAHVRIPAANLVDTTFHILGAKAYQSSFDPEAHVYFIMAVDIRTGEKFTTSLGGQAVVDLLDSLASMGVDSPLTVTLRHKQSGQFGGYYYLE